MSNDWILSIDFGTSNTAAAHTNPTRGGVEAVNLSHDRMTMTSSVYIETPDQVDTGDVALNKAEDNPDGFLAAPKRVVPQQVFQINGYDVPASTPVAAILDSVVKRASREHNNQRPSELVLTHPEAWSDAEVKVLLDAAEKLGLNATTIRTVSEPKAAAQYYSTNSPLEPGDKIAVFDFGGGTLDVAALQVQPDGSFHIIAARGDNTLGGKSFDAFIRRWVDQQLEDDHPEHLEYLRRRAPLSDRHAVEDSIRRAKELLSEHPTATISVPGDGETIRLQLTRSEFEEIIRHPVQRAVDLARATLVDAGISNPHDLKALYLTGGSSRVPLVQEEIKALGPVATLDDPKMVVAQGAISAVGPIVTGLHTAAAPTPQQSIHRQAASQQPTTSQQRPMTAPISAYQSQSQSPDTTAPAKKSKIKLIIITVGTLLAIAALVVAIVMFNKPSSSEKPNEEPKTTAATETTGETQPTNKATAEQSGEDVFNALPESINTETAACHRRTATLSPLTGTSISCEVALNGNNVQYFKPTSPYNSPNITFAHNNDDGAREKALIEQGHYNNNSDASPVSGANGNAAAIAIKDNDTSATLHYADAETGLVIESRDFASPEKALEWLEYHKLL